MTTVDFARRHLGAYAGLDQILEGAPEYRAEWECNTKFSAKPRTPFGRFLLFPVFRIQR